MSSSAFVYEHIISFQLLYPPKQTSLIMISSSIALHHQEQFYIEIYSTFNVWYDIYRMVICMTLLPYKSDLKFDSFLIESAFLKTLFSI